LRVAGARRPALLRRRTPAPWRAVDPLPLWRTHRRAHRRRVDRAVVPDRGRGGDLRAAALGPPAGSDRPRRRHADGQACECEPYVALAAYQRAKTGSLFAACTEVGALSAGADPAPWRSFGLSLGEAYQVADDVRDVAASIETMGKPAGRDVALQRPSSASELGLGARSRTSTAW